MTTQSNCEVWTPSDTGKKKGQNQPKGVSWCPVPAAHSQWLHHRRAIWRWARTLDRRGEWWKEVEIEGLRRSIHTSVRYIFGHLKASLRRFQGFLIPHKDFLVNGEYTLLTSWRLVRLPLIPQQPCVGNQWWFLMYQYVLGLENCPLCKTSRIQHGNPES